MDLLQLKRGGEVVEKMGDRIWSGRGSLGKRGNVK